MNQIFLLSVFIFYAFACQDPERVKKVIQNAQENAWAQLSNDTWCFPTYIGPMFVSEYYIELLALNLTHQSQFNTTYHTDLLLRTQHEDGSWQQVEDANLQTGGIDATIFNYLYLKTVLEDQNLEAIVRAKNYILTHGGLDSAQTMSKFKLALFGKLSWDDVYNIPLYFFKPDSYFYFKDITAQWVYPHMVPLAYLRDQQVVYKCGADISELLLNSQVYENKEKQNYCEEEPSNQILNLINEMLKLKRPKGSFGAYTVSTLLTMLALTDFTKKWPTHYRNEILKGLEDGFNFCEYNYFNSLTPYMGSADDGRWWDTILVSWGLLESGFEKERLIPIIDKMISEGLQPGKGIAYGWDFEYAPDVDDTGLLLAVLSYFENRYDEIKKQISDWIFSMQNKDGGFAAFDKDKQGNLIYQGIFKISGIADSAEIFDPSCADLTGHILEGIGYAGIKIENEAVVKAIQYLKQTQNTLGGWEGRWGINNIYAIGAVIPGLARINYDLSEEWVEKAIKWLSSKQNSDGGFGESTLSYTNPKEWIGRGISTVSQTSWALLALLEVKNLYDVDDVIDKAIAFLVNQFEENENKFKDISVVGTGHRGVIYLYYPSYPFSFPLIALSRYYKLTFIENI